MRVSCSLSSGPGEIEIHDVHLARRSGDPAVEHRKASKQGTTRTLHLRNLRAFRRAQGRVHSRGLGGGGLLASRVLAPLTMPRAATHTAMDCTLSHRVQLNGPRDEFRELADRFDAMLERLETTLRNSGALRRTPRTNCARRWPFRRPCWKSPGTIRTATWVTLATACITSTSAPSTSPRHSCC